MVNVRFDNLWPWFRFEPSDDVPGFRMTADIERAGSGLMPFGYGASGQPAASADIDHELGLFNWRPRNTGPFARYAASPIAADSEPQFPWLNPQSYSKEVRPDLKSPWLRVESEEESPDLRFASGGSIAPAPTGNRNAFGLDWLSHNFGLAAPFGARQFLLSESPTSEPSLEPPPWLSRMSGHNAGPDRHLAPRWPWLRAESEDDVPRFRLNPAGSNRQPNSASNVKLMAGAYDPPGQAVAENFSGVSPEPAVQSPAVPLDPLNQPTGIGGLTAGSLAVPMVDGMSGSQVGRAALSELAALARRAAPAIAGAAPAVSAALPFLFIPTNTQSETIDLGGGLRARLRPGQRSVEIERRVDNGLFGTGIGARWKTLPVDAELNAQDDGSARVLIDHRQLERAVGPDAAARASDAIGSAMARPPKKRKEDGFPPPAGIGHNSRRRPNPGNDGKPPIWPNVVTSAAELGGKALEHSNKSAPFDVQIERKLLEKRRQVMKAHRQQAPDGTYNGDDGIQVGNGMRIHPKLGHPSPGKDYLPDPVHPHLVKAYKGEIELANRIQTRMPDEVVVHFGNVAGEQGPDVVSVNPDGIVTVWESKYRTAPRSVGPSSIPAQTARSFQMLQDLAIEKIRTAVEQGRLAPRVGAKAEANLEQGNFIIVTAGTGNAHEGLVEFVQNRVRSKPRRQ